MPSVQGAVPRMWRNLFKTQPRPVGYVSFLTNGLFGRDASCDCQALEDLVEFFEHAAGMVESSCFIAIKQDMGSRMPTAKTKTCPSVFIGTGKHLLAFLKPPLQGACPCSAVPVLKP